MATPNAMVLEWLKSYQDDFDVIARTIQHEGEAPSRAVIGNYHAPLKRKRNLYIIAYLQGVEKISNDIIIRRGYNYYWVRIMIHIGFMANSQATYWEAVDEATWFLINHLESPLTYGKEPEREILLAGRLEDGPTFITDAGDNVSSRNRDQIDTLNRTQLECLFLAPSEKDRRAVS